MSGGAPPADYLVLAEGPPDQTPSPEDDLSADEVGEHMVDADEDVDVDDEDDEEEEEDNGNESPETGMSFTRTLAPTRSKPDLTIVTVRSPCRQPKTEWSPSIPRVSER